MSNSKIDSGSTTLENVKLTNREIEVLILVGEGQPVKAVADQLFISKHTVEFHLANVYAKLQVTNRIQAFQCARRLGLVDINET